MQRAICVHGHFYQPPREHPWLEVVEQQDSAYPFHDWNERITAECYGPNTHARILDADGRIAQLVNVYARMSFNIGPTLLAWLETEVPDVYADVIDADARSASLFGGHGSAMAQVYNHAILPLANARDQRTQVRWGIRDFEHRFGRRPEGMWLAEAAADDDALELLAEHGIRFTVLSPYQAATTRALGAAKWTDVGGGRVDPTMPYLVRLSSGREITVFFYDGPISRAVAFEGLLDSGDRFAARLRDGFSEREGPQLVNIATDGESYGHHHRHGEMALASALHNLARDPDVTVTNYAQWLDEHPPTHEAQIVQRSSWSCAHGVERWRSDCGCTTGGSGTHQRWRAPLRRALDWLRDELADRYPDAAGRLLADPWQARDDYIDVILDRSPTNVQAWLEAHAAGELGEADRRRAIQLLEIQRQAQLMYTSCGWFFDEVSRIETVQILRYAARAIQLAQDVHGVDLHEGFAKRLAEAESNVASLGDGRRIYEQMVEPDVIVLETVGAHFAISGLFHSYGEQERIGGYEVEREDYHIAEAGRARLAYGRATVRSSITLAERRLEFGVVHFGDHNFACGVRPAGPDEAYAAMADELTGLFAKADFPEVVRAIDDHLGDHHHSIRSLFRDEQRRILSEVLEATVTEAEAAYRNIFRGRAPLMRFLADLGAGVPPALASAAQIVLNAELRDELSSGALDPNHVAALIEEAERFRVELDHEGLGHTLSQTIQRLARHIREQLQSPALFDHYGPGEEAFTSRVMTLIETTRSLPFDVDLAPAQDVLWHVLAESRPRLVERAQAGDEAAARWAATLDDLARDLHLVVPTDA